MSQPRTPEQKLYEKLFKARKAAEAVEKRGRNDGEDYYFARFEDVLAEASEQLEKNRVLIVPQVIDERLHFSTAGFTIAKVVMEFEVIDVAGGASITRRWSGTGHDSPGDKAIYKAQTGCEKYFLAKLLGIPFGTDPEAEAGGDEKTGDTAEADRIRAEQDRAAEEPQTTPRHLKPVPESDLPEADWEGLAQDAAEGEPAGA